ncbi:MAG: cold-shock protein [Rhodothermales bacterium]
MEHSLGKEWRKLTCESGEVIDWRLFIIYSFPKGRPPPCPVIDSATGCLRRDDSLPYNHRVKEEMGTRRSVVKWFDAKKGYGFIHHPDGQEDIFVHYSTIDSDKRFKTLRTGQTVDFELQDGPKGLHAFNVIGHDDEDSEMGESIGAAIPSIDHTDQVLRPAAQQA